MRTFVIGMLLLTPIQGVGQPPGYPPPVQYPVQYQKIYAIPEAFYSSRRTYSEDQRDELVRALIKLVDLLEKREAGVVGAAPTVQNASKISVSMKSCVSCHSGSNAKGGLDLSSPDKVSQEDRVASLRAILKGTMPKGGGKISADDEIVFEKWAAQGEKK